MKHILLTNDDGIEAPGLKALLQAIKPLARLTVLAPDHNWSAAGHTKTMHKPLRAESTARPLAVTMNGAYQDDAQAAAGDALFL